MIKNTKYKRKKKKRNRKIIKVKVSFVLKNKKKEEKKKKKRRLNYLPVSLVNGLLLLFKVFVTDALTVDGVPVITVD